MRAVAVLIGAGRRRYTAYRAAHLAGAFTNSVFGFLRGAITVGAIGASGGTLGGYATGTAITFVWITQGLIGPVNVWAWNELALRIRTGDIAVDLARPLDLQLQWAAADLGRALATLLPRGLPPLLVGALTTGLVLPGSAWAYPLGAVSVLAAVLLSFAGRFLVNLTAFWLVEIRGVLTLYFVVSTLFSGLFVPVRWFPGWLLQLTWWTPFPYLIQVPADVLCGRLDGVAALGATGRQLLWLAALTVAGRWLLRRATRRLVVQGG